MIKQRIGGVVGDGNGPLTANHFMYEVRCFVASCSEVSRQEFGCPSQNKILVIKNAKEGKDDQH